MNSLSAISLLDIQIMKLLYFKRLISDCTQYSPFFFFVTIGASHKMDIIPAFCICITRIHFGNIEFTVRDSRMA